MNKPDPKTSITDLMIEFFDLAGLYVRQQTAISIEKAVLRPLRRLGFYLSLTIMAAILAALGFIFFFVGIFQLLAHLVGAPWIAYIIVGGLSFIGACLLALAGARFKT